ncbi:reverse transcriptase [Plakobranchus ocellatus]|uniref:Reverse transcriptase n=1 Tax=Plakobranchus ocellatus TaxID=259542 RepID=A0AAV4BL96_9GAST|nr:reverse transcriptase [Plakobranchus ocellatus]
MVAVFGLDLMEVVAGVTIFQKGTDRPVFRVVPLVHPQGTEIVLMLLARMLARVILDLVRAVFLIMLLVFSAVGRDMSAVNVRAVPGRQILLLWCQSCLIIAVPPRWIVILGVHLKIESCKVFDRVCTLLRDSACNTVGVSKSLAPPDCYTGKSILVNTFCCRDKLFPTCIIKIETPYFSGNVEACLMDSPIADVILGNINGLSSESPPIDSNSSDVFPNSSIACVVTRAQACKASFGNDLPISNNSTYLNVLDPFSDLPVRQREDPSLKLWFQRVGLPPVAGVSFRIEDGVLKRLYTKSKFSSVQTTIAVPEWRVSGELKDTVRTIITVLVINC